MSKGLVHIYTGDGKGKTTASVGLAARALGRGLRVGFFQFLKNGISGEVVSLAKLGAITACPETQKFIWDMDERERDSCGKKQRETFKQAVSMADRFDLLVLDEVITAVDLGFLDSAQVRTFIEDRPESLELALTGRCGRCDGESCAKTLLDCCDYFTEMKMVRHPFDEGQEARKGIEF